MGTPPVPDLRGGGLAPGHWGFPTDGQTLVRNHQHPEATEITEFITTPGDQLTANHKNDNDLTVTEFILIPTKSKLTEQIFILNYCNLCYYNSSLPYLEASLIVTAGVY